MMILKTSRSRAARLFDFLLTALAWLAFGYLFAAGIDVLSATVLSGFAPPVLARLLLDIRLLLAYLIVAACISLLLSVWAHYNALRFGRLVRRKPASDLRPETLALSFGISPAQIGLLHNGRVLSIQHTDEGRIHRIDFLPEQEAHGNVVQLVR
ncbi:MAG TPA: poly-beta-1,6-N-acetyl-D-glucosamine biosynthesis protein PgaD [Castellaniella sp.]|jgi:poly-beta-1,6-N-acetyl-D-glucosamine biosynthesis protein PgaD|nr:poly-beta-1,6-N-acetyl-D-glucosamine biosynthesis protein PgaD [Castellaniella sp.]